MSVFSDYKVGAIESREEFEFLYRFSIGDDHGEVYEDEDEPNEDEEEE